METKDFIEVVAQHCGMELTIPEEFTVDFHGARNKSGQTSYTAKDKNEVSVLYGFDKIFKAEKLSGIALCMAFAKIDSLGFKGGFETTKDFLIAMSELDIKTINSRINVGRSLFDLNGQPVVHRLLEFDWSKALEMVTIKKNDTNSSKAGLAQLNAYIDNGYITPNTSLSRLKSWKNILALGFIPKEWVVSEVDGETGKTQYSWFEEDGEHISESAPYPEEKTEDKKPEENKPKENKPEENKPEENKPEENNPEENKPEEKKALKPLTVLDGFTATIDTCNIEWDRDDKKKFDKAIISLSDILKKYQN